MGHWIEDRRKRSIHSARACAYLAAGKGDAYGTFGHSHHSRDRQARRLANWRPSPGSIFRSAGKFVRLLICRTLAR